MQSLSCSGRFARPFLSVIERYPDLEGAAERMRSNPADKRVEVERAFELIAHWTSVSRDEDLGLRASEQTCIGTGGALDYALHSAGTLRDSVMLLQRYAQLYSEALDVDWTIDGERVTVRVESKLAWPRAAADFTLSLLFRNHLRPHLGCAVGVECHFIYAEPARTELHRKLFPDAKLRFGSGFNGYTFDLDTFDRPLVSADPELHSVHCEHLESVRVAAPNQERLTARVRQLVASELHRGQPKSSTIARRLRMSRRTLVRRLADEGTSFTLQLDDLRRHIGLRMVSAGKLSLAEITTLLGFSHVQGFHRAFKRWTGQTPLKYRESEEDTSALNEGVDHPAEPVTPLGE